MTRLKQLEHFIEQSTLRHICQQAQHGGQRFCCFGFKLETQLTEFGCKPDRTNDADRIFAIPGHWIANHAQDFFIRVLHTAVIIHQILRLRVVVHGIDGEVAAGGVFILRAPYVVTQNTAT